MAKKDESFEALYQRLEEAVGKLEKGGLPLEQSIALYEEGMELAKRCQALLDGAEQRITKLRESFGQAAPLEEQTDGVSEDDVLEQEPLPVEDE